TWRLDVVDWHHDHPTSTPGNPRSKNAFCDLACTRCVGDVMVTLDVRLSLRRRTVRAINRKREGHERIRFRSHNTIVRQLLQRIAPLLPPDWAVIVQFDSWDAAKKPLQSVPRQTWQFSCGLKSTRKLHGIRLDEQNRRATHKWHTKISVTNMEWK